MGYWIVSCQTLGTHRKLMALCRILDVPDIMAVGLLHYLWWWALDNAPDGNLTGIDPADISAAAHWRGDPKLFTQALIAVRFVDSNDATGNLLLHDWDDYAGRLTAARASAAQRNRDYRLRLKLKSPRDSNGTVTIRSRDGNVTCNSNSNSNSNSNRTVIDTKEIDKEKQSSSLHDIFYSFKNDSRYLKIDFENEFKKFTEYWFEGKRKLKNHKLASHNWLDRALEYRKGGNNGINQGRPTGGTKLIERHSYTEAPYDPGLEADIAESDRISEAAKH